MNTQKNIIRFTEVAEQTTGLITRVIGFMPSRHIYTLFDNPALDANPRRPKVNRVTGDIISTLEETPELFQFKSKGLLIGTSHYSGLQRNRFELKFVDMSSEGVLDGGHNMLSIGLFLLKQVMDERDWKKVKEWDDFLDAWDEFREDVEQIRDDFDFLIPVELLIPSDDEQSTVEEFNIALIDICAARNNNAQLAQEAKANQRGFYDEIRKRMVNKVPEVAERVEWKTNEWEATSKKPIKVRDIIAMSWLPLNVLADANALTQTHRINPVQIYSSKGKCSQSFDELYETKDVSNQTANGKYELHNTTIGSAFDILADLPELYDWIVFNFRDAYNNNNGKFGRIDAVKMISSTTPYFQKEMDHKVPDGFVMPVFYGLTALMEFEDGKVKWKTDPTKFLDRWFPQIIKGYRIAMEMAQFDPQKIAKNDGSYDLAVKEFKFALMEQNNPG